MEERVVLASPESVDWHIAVLVELVFPVAMPLAEDSYRFECADFGSRGLALPPAAFAESLMKGPGLVR